MPVLLPVPEIAIGENRVDKLGDDLAGLGGEVQRVLVVIDPALTRIGVAERVGKVLDGASRSVAVFDELGGEPTSSDIDAAVRRARAEQSEAVVGVGGGSALDVAKLVGAIASGAMPVEHYQFCANPLPRGRLPVIGVPTTAGTGSETTTTAVFTNAAGKKAWVWGPELACAKAVLDSSLTQTLPPHLAAATGLDALVHAIEAATNANAFACNSETCFQAIRLIATTLPAVVAGRGTAADRERLLVASMLAGVGINNCGTAIAHNIAHALGSLAKVHHGRAAALGLRASLPWNITHNRQAYAAVAAAMGGPNDAGALPDQVDRLIRAVGIPVSLAAECPGLTAERLAREMAAPENASMRASNARPSTPDDLLQLAEALLDAT